MYLMTQAMAIVPLYGSLKGDEQRRAFEPVPDHVSVQLLISCVPLQHQTLLGSRTRI